MESVQSAGGQAFPVRVQYHALFRTCARRDFEILRLGDGDPARLYDELRRRYRFPLHRTLVRLAVNGSFARWEDKLKSGDLVVFLPPVSGG